MQLVVEIWESISDECKDLIRKMLYPAEKRISAEQVLQHEWFKHSEDKAVYVAFPQVMTNQLLKFKTCQKMKRAVLTYLATQSSENEIMSPKMYFNCLDKNGDGILSKDEIMTGIKDTTVSVDLSDIVESLDTNNSGFVDYNGTHNKMSNLLEFLAAGLQEEIYLRSDKLVQAFSVFDKVNLTL